MNTRALLVCIVVVLIAVWGATYLPLSTESVRIVKLADASDSIAVAAGQHMRQRVHLSVGTYSGIAVFSDAVSMDERVLMAFVEDRQGRRVAVGQNNSITYRSSANVTRIEVDTSWFTVTHDDFYVLDMVFPHGEPLPLRTIARDSNLSAVHKLSLDGDSKPAILSLSFMKRIPAVFGLRQGIIIGVAFLLAVVLISLMQDRKKKLWAAIVIIIIFAPLAILGYWFSDGDWASQIGITTLLCMTLTGVQFLNIERFRYGTLTFVEARLGLPIRNSRYFHPRFCLSLYLECHWV